MKHIYLNLIFSICCGNLAFAVCPPLVKDNYRNTSVNFIAFGDSQIGYDADRGDHPAHHVVSAHNGNALQVKALNTVYDRKVRWPRAFNMGAGKIGDVRGVLIAGDVTAHAKQKQWTVFEDRLYGLCGTIRVGGIKGALKYPVYEGYGNHDFSLIQFREEARNPIIEAIGDRNHLRSNIVRATERHRAHYSWKWDNVHFINVNVKASNHMERHYYPANHRNKSLRGKIARRIKPHKSLTFLRRELNEYVRDRETPVVIMMHYPPYDQRMHINGVDEETELYETIKDFNVVAIVAGHTHQSRHVRWRGIDVFETGGPYHWKENSSYAGHFTLFRITNNELLVKDIQWRPRDRRNPANVSVDPDSGWSFRKAIKNSRK